MLRFLCRDMVALMLRAMIGCDCAPPAMCFVNRLVLRAGHPGIDVRSKTAWRPLDRAVRTMVGQTVVSRCCETWHPSLLRKTVSHLPCAVKDVVSTGAVPPRGFKSVPDTPSSTFSHSTQLRNLTPTSVPIVPRSSCHLRRVLRMRRVARVNL